MVCYSTIIITFFFFCRESIYLGPYVSGRNLIEKSKQLKLISKIKLYNLENDDLFGRPLNTKWIRQEK